MSGKFGIAFLTACSLFIQATVFNPSGNFSAENSTGQNVTIQNGRVSSPCSVDQNFYVSAGVSQPDGSFGAGGVQPGIDAGFGVKICKGVSVPDTNSQGGQ